MNSAARVLVPVGILAAAVVGLVFFGDSGAPDLDPMRPPPEEPRQEQPGPSNGDSNPIDGGFEEEAPQPRERTVVDTDTSFSAPDAAQGVMGRVLTPDGRPADDVEVFLMKSASSDPFEIFLANKQGRTIPPVSQTVTDDAGRFRLGVDQVGDSFDLRVVSEQYPELNHGNIRVKKDDWYDTRDLRLEQGLVVQGMVLEEGTNLPVTNAVVYLQSTNATHTLLPTPGREKGLMTPVDAGGFYQFVNAPTEGTISLAAEAPDYARVERLNLQISRDQNNKFDLMLPRGMPIAGAVMDSGGQPVAEAEIVATALSNKTPQTGKGVTGRDGRFEIPGLRDGPYQVVVTAKNYEEKTEQPVMAGTRDLMLTLEARASVRVKVLASNGSPVRSYHLSLKRHFPDNPLGIGNVMEFPDRTIGPGDQDQQGFATVSGIPVNGQFVWQVRDSRHAKTLSEPFQAVSGGPPPEVVVTMVQGGSFRGRVIDDRGRPVSGAVVRTEIEGGFALDTPFGQLFSKFMPDKITKTDDRTDAQGRFELSQLAYGDYELRVSHPEFCEGVSRKLSLTGDQTIDVGDIQLARGALISGIARFNGQPSGQIKIQISPPQNSQPEVNEQGQLKSWFTAVAYTDNNGRYTLPKRVPPGNYEIYASKQTGDNNPFVALLQIQQSKRPLTVVAGQERIEQNFNLTQ